MAWTTPITWTQDQFVDPTAMNVQVRDNMNALFAGALPAGAMMPFAGAAAPTGYLLCDGATLNATASPQYAALFAAIGTRYGGSGITSFNVPNVIGRTIKGITSGSPTVPTTITSDVANHTHGGVTRGAVSTYGVDGFGSGGATVPAIELLFIIKL